MLRRERAVGEEGGEEGVVEQAREYSRMKNLTNIEFKKTESSKALSGCNEDF